MVIRPITVPLSRCECSANLSISVSQPCGLTEPLDSGQSGNAIPAPIVVVKAPSATSTNTQALPMAANQARAGLYVAVRDIRQGLSWKSGRSYFGPGQSKPFDNCGRWQMCG